jgi:hypothetical protein
VHDVTTRFLKVKERNEYTSALPLGLHILLQEEIYLFLSVEWEARWNNQIPSGSSEGGKTLFIPTRI